MSNERQLKCYGFECEKNKKKYPKSQLVEIKGKRYCAQCYESILDKDEYRNAFINAYRSYTGVAYPSGFVLKQMKEFNEVRGYSYKGMVNAITYFNEVKGQLMDANKGIVVLSYVYDEAQSYYDNKEKIQNKIDNAKYHDVDEVKTVHVKNYFSDDSWREKTLKRINNRSQSTDELEKQMSNKNAEKNKVKIKEDLVITREELEILKETETMKTFLSIMYPTDIPIKIDGKFVSVKDIPYEQKGIYAYYKDLGYNILN